MEGMCSSEFLVGWWLGILVAALPIMGFIAWGGIAWGGQLFALFLSSMKKGTLSFQIGLDVIGRIIPPPVCFVSVALDGVALSLALLP